MLYALIIDDNDVSYQDVNSSNDVTMVNGAWTDEFNRIAGDRFHLPNIGLGEYAYGWWILDIDGDLVADGTDPTNWDTDGDWLNDFFEIDDDLLDGIRGNRDRQFAMMTELLNSTFHLLLPLQNIMEEGGPFLLRTRR